MDRSFSRSRRLLLIVGFGIASALSVAPAQAQEMCGGTTYPFPYTDVSGVGAAFCPGIMEAYVTGVSKGTTPTTFSPNENVTRVQMTTFLQRSLDQGLERVNSGRRLNQWWTPRNTNAMQTITLPGSNFPSFCAADGENIWDSTFGEVNQVQASTGKVLGTWTGATSSNAVLVAAGKVYVAGGTSPGKLYVIDPTQAPGPVTTAASNLGDHPNGIAFDGTNIWTANAGLPGSVSIITPQSPYTVTTVTSGFTELFGILYDGANIWVTDQTAGTLLQARFERQHPPDCNGGIGSRIAGVRRGQHLGAELQRQFDHRGPGQYRHRGRYDHCGCEQPAEALRMRLRSTGAGSGHERRGRQRDGVQGGGLELHRQRAGRRLDLAV